MTLLAIAGLALLATAGPVLLLGVGWLVVPAAVVTAVSLLVALTVGVMLLGDCFAAVQPYFERPLDDHAPLCWGHALYFAVPRLDASARAAGLPPLSDFEAADDLQSGVAPRWHAPAHALPTVEHLLAASSGSCATACAQPMPQASASAWCS